MRANQKYFPRAIKTIFTVIQQIRAPDLDKALEAGLLWSYIVSWVLEQSAVGAWQIYEEINPTLERALWREGRSRSPISPALLKTQEVSSNTASEYLSSENYGCFQRFFPGVNLPENNTSGSSTQSLTNPFSDSSSSSSPVLGCALMRLVPKDSGNFFLKSEITFKNDTQGWAIWTHLTNHNAKASDKVFLYFRILFLGRSSTSDTWSIKGGVYLKHFGSTISGNPSISAPDGEWKDYTKEKYYSGFWESKTNSDSAESSNGKKLMSEIKMEYDGHNKLFSNGDIYTSTDQSNSLTCKGIYDTTNNKWTTWTNGSNCCISNVLKQAFQSFKDKVGTWTPAESYCKEAGNKRYKSLDDTTKDRAKELCYPLPQNSTTAG